MSTTKSPGRYSLTLNPGACFASSGTKDASWTPLASGVVKIWNACSYFHNRTRGNLKDQLSVLTGIAVLLSQRLMRDE